jgi:hypothetical protein
MRPLLVVPTLAAEILSLAEQVRVEAPQTTYQLTTTAPVDDKMAFLPKPEKPYSENPRHAKPHRRRK